MLLVTTSHSLILLDPDKWRAWQVTNREGLYYGLAHNEENIYVAARGRLVSSEIPPEQEEGKIIIYNKLLRRIAEITAPFPLRDMHQISIIDDKLWVTCSFDNKIAIFDGDKWEEWFPLERPVTQPFDKNHFNSLTEFGPEVCVVAHNKGPSELYFFDKATRLQTRVIPLGEAAHNVWLENDAFYTCSSAEGTILSTNGSVINVGGFTRGIVVDDERYYVGVSELAERKARDFTDGFVKVFNKEWEEEVTVILRGEGLILDLMQIKSPFLYSKSACWLNLLRWRRINLELNYFGE